ncbi:hypothetical protein [Roseibium sp. LAB1]
MTSTKDNESPLRTRRETAESKAETTRRIAREINEAEASARDAKTARLKAARLANQDQKAAIATSKAAPAKTRKRARPKA